jgi:hypothetical protein
MDEDKMEWQKQNKENKDDGKRVTRTATQNEIE